VLDRAVEALMAGRLEDALRAGRKATRERPDLAEAHMLLAEVQRLLGDAPRAAESRARALRLRPGWSAAQLDLALADLYRDFGRLGDAEERCRAALALEPALADARFNLAGLLSGAGRAPEAIAELEALLARQPEAAEARGHLVRLLYEQRSIERLEAVCREGVALHPQASFFAERLGAALWFRGRHEEALDAFAQALARAATREEKEDASLSAANAQLALGRYDEGWRSYHFRHTRSRVAAAVSGLAPEPARLAELSRPARILIRTEQGLGDEIFFLRFAVALRARGHRLSVAGEPKLDGLLAMMPELFEVPSGGVDYAIASGDLPLASGVSFAPPLPLPVDPARKARLQATLAQFGPPPYVGVTWQGGPVQGDATPQRGSFLRKVVSPEELGRGLAPLDARIVILQRKPAAEDLQRFTQALGRRALDLSVINDDLREALAALSLLDDYVGSSNTNFHLRAGLAGRPARVMVTSPTNWRWGIGGASSPWFPAFRVYRRELGEDWSQALGEIRRDLS
jgi:tetratricopeptide (TPR) repeat protein